MAVIYKATNKINGKSYIGYATNFVKRRSVHRHNCLNEGSNTSYFHRAIQKYGWENFDWSILKENATLNDEIELIEKYETFHIYGKGYNLTKGGDGNLGWVMSEETKNKISKSNKGNKYCLGRKLSDESKNKISKSLTGRPSSKKGKPSPLRGKKQSPELIEKRISARMRTLDERNNIKKQGF